MYTKKSRHFKYLLSIFSLFIDHFTHFYFFFIIFCFLSSPFQCLKLSTYPIVSKKKNISQSFLLAEWTLMESFGELRLKYVIHNSNYLVDNWFVSRVAVIQKPIFLIIFLFNYIIFSTNLIQSLV